MLLETPTIKKVPAAMPQCPQCGKSDAVRCAGFYERAKGRRVQQYRCKKQHGGCNAWFADPQRERISSGRPVNVKAIARALAMRRRGLLYRQIGAAMGVTGSRARTLCNYRPPAPHGNRIGCRFEIVVRPELLPALRGLYFQQQRHEPENDFEIAEYLSEKIECEYLAPYNLAHLSPQPDGRVNNGPVAGHKTVFNPYKIVALESEK